SPHLASLSLHDALPICPPARRLGVASADGLEYGYVFLMHRYGLEPARRRGAARDRVAFRQRGVRFRLQGVSACDFDTVPPLVGRSEEHTSELQSRENLV